MMKQRFHGARLLTTAALMCAIGMFSQSAPGQTGAAPVSIDEGSAASTMRGYIERYNSDYNSIDRGYSGRISPGRTDRMKKFTSEWIATMKAIPFEKLGHEDQVDDILFQNYLNHELRQLDLNEKSYAEMSKLIPFARTIGGLEDARLRLEWANPESTAVLFNAMTKSIAALQASLGAGAAGGAGKTAAGAPAVPAVKKSTANRAAETVAQTRKTLTHWYEFYQGYDPSFTWWAAAPYKKLDETLKAYGTFLKEKLVGISDDDKTTIIGNPIGREAILSELEYQMIPYTPEELIAIAKTEFEWCDAEMKKASRELGYGDDWKKALEHVKTLHVEPGKQTELVKTLAHEAVDFVDQHDLVTVPPLAREDWHMEMLSPEWQKTSPFFLGGEDILVAFPTNEMEQDQKMMSMRGNNIHFSRATVFHELIPGHHLQAYMNQRYRTYRDIFSTPFWTEGWAFYWEMIFWDLGFPKTPENKIGMLFWRMHRCARIIFSLSFHLEKMTPQECIDFLVDRVGHERDNATAEVRRSFNGGYGPLYQCAYMLGALQFRSLHKEFVDSGKMTNRAFHDAILKENNVPVEMVRAILSNQSLQPAYHTSWKFYGEHPLK